MRRLDVQQGTRVLPPPGNRERLGEAADREDIATQERQARVGPPPTGTLSRAIYGSLGAQDASSTRWLLVSDVMPTVLPAAMHVLPS
jgi:hypothetical protein